MGMYACNTCGTLFGEYRVRCTKCLTCDVHRRTDAAGQPFMMPDTDAFDESPTPPLAIVSLAEIEPEKLTRIPCGIEGVDRIFGGGIILGKTVIVASPPGVGKSTMIIQIAAGIDAAVLYVSAEMPSGELSALATRVYASRERIHPIEETDLDAILRAIDVINPTMVVIDSIQKIETRTLGSRAGSPAQVIECTKRLRARSIKDGFALWLIGHVTTDDRMAGPRELEHDVDAVLELEGDPRRTRRVLRSGKIRGAAPGSAAVFTMTAHGLVPCDDDETDDEDELDPEPTPEGAA